MIDIHSHILPLVDDGSKSLDDSLTMLKNLKKIGVKDVVLTPHNRGIYLCSKGQLKKEFEKFKKASASIGINLYLGQEIYYNDSTLEKLKSGELLTINNSKHVLLEFGADNVSEIVEFTYLVKKAGFIPIIAHPERYNSLDSFDIEEIKSVGGLIQINASSIINGSFSTRRMVKKLLKLKLVDFIASDIHFNRKLVLDKAKKYVSKKFGKEMADVLFELNAKEILKG